MQIRPSISVIIPTWREAPLIADAVRSAETIGDEVIVVDAGSPDGTAAIAVDAGARVVFAPKGRGVQLHAGAEAATGSILLFLHADARLPSAARQKLLDLFDTPGVIGGNFLIRFIPESWFTRRLVPINDLRRRLTRRYYGDSAIFIQAEKYWKLGGVRPYPLMHDYEFSKRMERHGRCVYIRDVIVTASARRFEGRELRTVLTWIMIQLLYWLDISPELLAKAYPDRRGEQPDRFVHEWHVRRTDEAGGNPDCQSGT